MKKLALALWVAFVAATCNSQPDERVVIQPPPDEWYEVDYEYPTVDEIQSGDYPDQIEIQVSNGLRQAITERWELEPDTEWSMCLLGDVDEGTVWVYWYLDPGYYYRFRDRVFSATCPIGTVGTLHSHPTGQCSPSIQDIRAFKSTIAYHARPMIFMGLACGPDPDDVRIFGWEYVEYREDMHGELGVSFEGMPDPDWLIENRWYKRYRALQDSIAEEN